MNLTTVEIWNFRCIEHLRVDLDETTVVIGENNSGKTAFLDAIRICLDPSFRRRRRPFEYYDYRLSAAATSPAHAPPIRIELTFAEREPEEWSPDFVQDFEDAIDRDPEDRGLIRIRVRSLFQGETAWEFLTEMEEKKTVSRPSLVGRLQRNAHVYYLSALRDAERHFAPRGRFWRDFLDETGIPEAARDDLEKDLNDLNSRVVREHAPLSKVRGSLEDLKRVIDLAESNAVSVDALPGKLFALLSRAEVSLAARSGVRIPLFHQGQGTQSLAVLALFSAFLRNREEDAGGEAQPITALEEPEAHLHPSAVRALMRVVNEIPGQKLIATHSGDLMAEVRATWVRRFVPEDSGIAVHRIAPEALTVAEAEKFEFHVKRMRGELLFARCWFLVEGETEEILFAGAARAMNRDLDRAGVRLIKITGAGPTVFVKAAKALGICWFCVVDKDKAGADYRKSIAAVAGPEPARRFVVSPYESPEKCLFDTGFHDIYEVSAPKPGPRPAMPTGASAPKVVPRRGLTKPSAAAKAVAVFGENEQRIPKEIRDTIDGVLDLVGQA